MAKEQKPLSEQQRAERVLASVGRAAGLLGSFPADVKAKLASFCTQAGEVTSGARAVLDEYWDAQKATVEPEPVPELRDIAAAQYETYKLPKDEAK